MSSSQNEKHGDQQIPASVIAQAEAAIYGHLEVPDSPSETRRRPSIAEQSSTNQNGTRDQRSGTTSSRHPFRPTISRTGTSRSYHQGPSILRDGATEAPPAYGDKLDQIEMSQDGFDTQAKVTDDGRINININQKTRKLSDLLVPALRNQLSLATAEEEEPLPPGYIPPALGGLPGQTPPPKLNVVIHVVGSRGDVQPFVALGKTLKATYGHRVRLATHPTFQTFVEENGLEFFSIGGDPSELMAFMVKNPGLMPGFDSLKSGDVGKRRKGMEEIVLGCWRSCIESGNGLGAPPRRDSTEFDRFDAGIDLDAAPSEKPFIADAIIANPPSFAHVHIAEKMGIPLHMMFTMPWSPTQQFPHPLANIQSSNADVNMTNFVSYALVEMMTWQGLGDVINRFRERALGLDPISLIWAPGMLSRLRIPYTYCWSPALIPKPKDWNKHISVSGFYFLSLASSYTPDPELAAFLAAGPPPVYIGFGSIVVDDPNALTTMIFEAVKIVGCRALVSKGWGGLGGDALNVPEGVFMLGNVPHDWLFQHVSAVCHHGGAGTTAAGIATGKPTVVVPFFGDQPFWGAMVARAGAGPLPVPYKQLTAEKLAAALSEALKPETQAKAKEYGLKIKEEKGTEVGAKSFHDNLDIDTMRCTLAPSRIAVWRVKRTQTRLSAFAANVLASEGMLDFADLKLYRPKEYETEDGPWDPISGGASALVGTIGSLMMGVADFPLEIFKSVRAKKEEKALSKQNSLEDHTPTSASRSSLSLESKDLESEDTSTAPSTVGGSSKTSYESTSLSNAPTLTPTSSATSIEKVHRTGSNSLREALRGTLSRSRSVSRDRSSVSRSDSRNRSHHRTNSQHNSGGFDPSTLTLENAIGAGKGVQRIVAAGMKSPMDFTLSIARGFHNAPKLYGDDTVRPSEKVTGLQSGLKVAGKEFGLGFYDGITGLVTQPLRGVEKEGAAGFFKGVGKGIGGLILKPGAAIWGLPGYTFMGINKEIKKLFGSSVTNYVISARTAQGFEDAKNATAEERRDVLSRWNLHKDEYQSEKQKIVEHGGPEGQDTGHLTPKGFMQTRHLSFDERKKLHGKRKAKREEEARKVHGDKDHPMCPFCRRKNSHTHTPREEPHLLPEDVADHDHDEEFEQAIKASVAATSRGNADEDAMIERAIRASVRELYSAQESSGSDHDALNRAIQASIAEAEAHRREAQQLSSPHDEKRELSEEEAEHQAALERAIQESLLQYQLKVHDHEGEAEDEDEDVRRAIQMSKELNIAKGKDVASIDDDDDFKLALQKSKESAEKEKNEEDVVLEYVKKQSLLEGKMKESVPDKGPAELPADESNVDKKEKSEQESAADEEALRLAIEESMKGAGSSSQP